VKGVSREEREAAEDGERERPVAGGNSARSEMARRGAWGCVTGGERGGVNARRASRNKYCDMCVVFS